MNQALTLRVRYFAALREALGAEATVQVPPGCTVAALREQLAGSSAAHAAALGPGRAVRCAVNQALSPDDAVLPPQAEVAFFPPVTGG